MSGETRWIWRLIGCLGVPLSACFAMGNLDAYMRHRGTSDGVGFALGMTFLNFCLVPATTIALVRSVAPARPHEQVSGWASRLVRLVLASILAAGTLFFLWFPVFVRRLEVEDLPPGHDVPWQGWLYYGVVEPGILIAFAVLLAGCAVAVVQPSAAGSRWFTAMLVGVGIVGAGATVVLLSESLQSVILTLPTVALVLVVAWTLHAIHRDPGKESAAG